MVVRSLRAFVRTERDEEAALYNTQEDKSGRGPKFCSSRRKTYEGKPREDHVEGLVDEFDENQEFAREAVRRPIYVMELDSAVSRSEALGHLQRCETSSGTPEEHQIANSFQDGSTRT